MGHSPAKFDLNTGKTSQSARLLKQQQKRLGIVGGAPKKDAHVGNSEEKWIEGINPRG